MSTLKRPSLFEVWLRCFLGRFETKNGIFHSLFTAFAAPCEKGSALEVFFGPPKSRKIRGPGHAIWLVNYGILNAPDLALLTGDSFFLVLRAGREKKHVRGDSFFGIKRYLRYS